MKDVRDMIWQERRKDSIYDKSKLWPFTFPRMINWSSHDDHRCAHHPAE
jgi:hypothetical protein